MLNKLVSVIVPVYNVATYLPTCLDSILKQSYPYIEVICINDGSTDESLRILNEYKNKDSRICIINQKNAGLSAARNIGISTAKGDWITFVDSDDCINIEFIERLISTAVENNCDLAISRYANFDDDDNIEKLIKLKHKSQAKYSALNTGTEIYKLAYTQNDGVTLNTAWGKLYKRKLFKEIRFPLGLIHEDEFTTYKTYLLSDKAVFLDERLYFYRSRPGSIMKSLKPENEIEVLDAFKNRIDDFSNDSLLKTLAVNDYLIRISGMIYSLQSSKYYKSLINRYRKELINNWAFLNKRAKIERSIAFVSPKLYCKIRCYLIKC